MKKAKIVGIGKYIPENIIDVQDIKQQERLTDSKIERMQIKTIHRANKGETPTSMAIAAGQDAFKNCHVKPEEIDLVIYSYGFIPDYLAYPDHARIQDGLGIKNATSFTIKQGCNGMIESLEIAKLFLEAGKYKNILIAGADRGDTVFGNGWHATSYCVIGEGAAAAILSMDGEGSEILSTYSFTDGFYSDINYVEFGMAAIPDPNNFDFKVLRYDTIPQAIRFWEERGGSGVDFLTDYQRNQIGAITKCLELADMTLADLDFVVNYNMSYEVHKPLFETLGIPLEKTAIDLHSEFGHMGAADPIFNLSILLDRGKVKKGDIALLTSAGAGLTWGNGLIRI